MGDGGLTAGADLVDDSAAQLANEAIEGAFNERTQQLPEQRRIPERLQPPGFPVPNFAVAEPALAQHRLKERQLLGLV